jgi:cyclic-di-GMP phosphodiesterase TipF (flagellum assembly factor)
MAQVLLAAIYIMASVTVALGLQILGLAEPRIAALIGIVIILAFAQVHSVLRAAGERRRTRRELAELKRGAKAFSRAIEDTHAKIDEVHAAIEARASAQNRKIVSELQVLESLMRDFAGKLSEKAKQQPTEPAEAVERRTQASVRAELTAFGHSDLLETIRASLEENRVDLYLQPIVSLPQRKLRFYEALSRLRAEDGTVIMPSQYIRVAAPAGLMSVVDNLLLFRCVQIMRRLIQKNRDIGMFCNISGDTLGDAEFFPQFLEYMHHNRDLAPQIVFEFAQDAVLAAGQKGEENLTYLSSLGFGLSMDHVETLALDFTKLKALGFRHLKVRAETLTSGMDSARAAVSAEDLKQLLERHGLNLIAERVEQEKTVVQLLEFGVDFAQGYLFGEPRAVRDDQKTLPDAAAPIIPFRRAG